jgi:hypothetical protein
VTVDSQSQSKRESTGPSLAPYCPLTGTVLVILHLENDSQGFEMPNISTILSMDHKVCITGFFF